MTTDYVMQTASATDVGGVVLGGACCRRERGEKVLVLMFGTACVLF